MPSGSLFNCLTTFKLHLDPQSYFLKQKKKKSRREKKQILSCEPALCDVHLSTSMCFRRTQEAYLSQSRTLLVRCPCCPSLGHVVRTSSLEACIWGPCAVYSAKGEPQKGVPGPTARCTAHLSLLECGWSPRVTEAEPPNLQ